MTAVNDVLEIDGTCFRIIWQMENEFVLFPLYHDALELENYSAEQIADAFKNGTAKNLQDPYEGLRMSAVSPKLMERAQSRFDSIQELVSDPRLYNPITRKAVFRDASGGDKKLLIKLKRNLLAFWKKGLSVTALIPESGRTTGIHSSGRKGKCPRSPEMEAHLEMICKKYLLKQNHVSMDKAYIHSLDEWERKYPGTPAPSRTQLRYYFEQHYTKLERAIKQNTAIRFNKDIRSLRGKAADMTEGPGGIYEIDSTTDDVYLVSSRDPNQVVGRPTLYIVSDVFSGMIVGINVTLESATFNSASDTLYSAFAPKAEFCRRYGVEITEDAWPCSGIPAQIVCDNAELMGYQSDLLVGNLGITLHNTGSYRGDQKGNVERLIELIQSSVSEFIKAKPSKVKLKKAGAEDLRPYATLTLSKYMEIAITMAIACNNHLRDYLPDGYPQDGKPSSIEIWKWGQKTGRNCLVNTISIATIRILMLPRYEASFSREGILASGAPITSLRYWNSELDASGAFIRNSTPYRPKNAWIALDPADISVAYLFDEPDNITNYKVCQLAPQCSQYKNMTLWEGQHLNKARQEAYKAAQEEYDQMRKKANRKVSEICSEAEKRKTADTKEAKKKIKDLVEARKEELSREQKNNRRVPAPNSSDAEDSVSDTSDNALSAAAPSEVNETSGMEQSESDYHYPASIKDIHD